VPDQLQKCAVFADLHLRDEAWLIPNPWDIGSARVLQGLGFQALATTSSGFAFTLGRADGTVTLDEKLQHCRELSAAVTIPVNADFENGFSDDRQIMQANIQRLLETGIAGLSIEDFSRDEKRLYDFAEATDRIAAAVEAVKGSGIPVLLTARAENLIRGSDDLEDTVKRLQAYEAAGADVLYAPGLMALRQVREVAAEVSLPLNVLAPFIRNASVAQLSEAGATRISTGGALTWASLNPLLMAGKEMLEKGSFDWLGQMAKGTEIQSLLNPPQ